MQASHCGGFSCRRAQPVGHMGFSSCRTRGLLLPDMWNLLRPRIKPVSPALADRFESTVPPGKPPCVCVKSLKSCLTLCDPKDYSPPGSSVHGILQARMLEWLPLPSPGVRVRVRVFLTQGSNPCLSCFLQWQAGSSRGKPPGSFNSRKTTESQ